MREDFMKIEIINNLSINTGIGNYAFSVYNELKKLKQVEVEMVHRDSFPYPTKVSKILSSPFRRIHYLKKFSNLINLDANIYHFSAPGIVSSYFGPKVKGLEILTIHDLYLFDSNENGLVENRLKSYMTKSLATASGIIFDSYFTRDSFYKHFDFKGKAQVVHLGVDHDTYFKSDKAKSRQQLNLRLDFKYILFTGTTIKRKNVETLLKAFSLIERHINNVCLMIIGGNIPLLKKMAKYYGINHLLCVPVVKPNIVNLYYNSADVFVFPSLYEGFGIPVVEAMSTGLPIVASKSSSIPEIVSDSAILIDPIDVESIASEVMKIFLDKEIEENLSKKSLERSLKFNWQKTALETSEFYKSLLS